MEKTISLKDRQRELIRQEQERNLQAKIDLIEHIQIIGERAGEQAKERRGEVQLKQIRQTRQKERARNHVDFSAETGIGEAEESTGKTG